MNPGDDRRWKRGDRIALASLIVSLMLGVLTTLAAWLGVPGFRDLLSLREPHKSPIIDETPKPASEKSSGDAGATGTSRPQTTDTRVAGGRSKPDPSGQDQTQSQDSGAGGGAEMNLSENEARDWYQRGQDCLNQQQFLDAIDAFTRAIQQRPDYAEAYSYRGVAFAARGQYDRAIQEQDLALKLAPTAAYIYYNRGNAYYGKSDYPRAIQDYNQALSFSPSYAAAVNNRGLAYEKQGRLVEALADFDRALNSNPYFELAKENRGRVAAELHK